MSPTTAPGPDGRRAPARWPSQILASHHTLSGVVPRTTSRFSFRRRLEAARAAGYDGVGLAYYDFAARPERGESIADLRRAVAETGIPVVELEILYGWNDAGDDGTSRDAESWLHRMAEVFGARHMNVAVAEPPGVDLDWRAVAERFGAVCDRAADAGLIVALEFQPLNAIADLRTAWDVVRAADRANGGILLDSWHFFRSDPDFDLLAGIPPEKIAGVQINDAAPEPIGTLWEDTIRRRRVPGAGAFPLARFVDTLRAMGVDCPVAVELISDEQLTMDVEEVARRSYAATSAVLDR